MTVSPTSQVWYRTGRAEPQSVFPLWRGAVMLIRFQYLPPLARSRRSSSLSKRPENGCVVIDSGNPWRGPEGKRISARANSCIERIGLGSAARLNAAKSARTSSGRYFRNGLAMAIISRQNHFIFDFQEFAQ